MKKLFAFTAAACLMSAAMPSTAHAAYLFGFSPSGSQTLTINGTTVIQANQTGWFDGAGQHVAGNTNYYVADAAGGNHNNFFGFDLSNVSAAITSAVLNVGNNPSSGLSGGPVTWTLFDFNGTLNSSLAYSDLGIWADLGSGTSYGSAFVAGPTNNVSVALNGNGLAALNAARGSSFFLGGSLGAGAVPEPATWAMMIMGFGFVGGAMRRRKQNVRVSFA